MVYYMHQYLRTMLHLWWQYGCSIVMAICKVGLWRIIYTLINTRASLCFIAVHHERFYPYNQGYFTCTGMIVPGSNIWWHGASKTKRKTIGKYIAWTMNFREKRTTPCVCFMEYTIQEILGLKHWIFRVMSKLPVRQSENDKQQAGLAKIWYCHDWRYVQGI